MNIVQIKIFLCVTAQTHVWRWSDNASQNITKYGSVCHNINVKKVPGEWQARQPTLVSVCHDINVKKGPDEWQARQATLVSVCHDINVKKVPGEWQARQPTLVSVCHDINVKKVPDEWQARRAALCKHGAKKNTTICQSQPYLQTKKEKRSKPRHVTVYLFLDLNRGRSRLVTMTLCRRASTGWHCVAGLVQDDTVLQG